MYVKKEDYKSRISLDLLDKIIAEGQDAGEDILTTISKIAEDTISTMAGVLYDTAGELAKVGAARNYLVLAWALKIATYELYQRTDDDDVPKKVIKNYDDTFEELMKVSTGKFPLTLPPKPDEPAAPGGGDSEAAGMDGNGLRRIGSQPKRTHNM